ncbi:DUF4148 domain-containing protein [Bordetella genomosp. 13]|uniref:DUF4148 domain-containing protein n=1 Tax=Bordetella genomosp. 13 TaxID=463040 RepID=A0A1W6ZCX3_9BORD|nr:DUF4148 domain-containing protein [Bordetella genomosp. 13]ARP95238.1 hypothetical protein CAL15_13100 [Bordetella genomosp. 13]
MNIPKIRYAIILAACFAAGNAMALTSSAATNLPDTRELTRAEVQADLDVWKRAGMEEFWVGESTPDIYSTEYRAAYRKYLQMRHGAEYQEALRERSAQ